MGVHWQYPFGSSGVRERCPLRGKPPVSLPCQSFMTLLGPVLFALGLSAGMVSSSIYSYISNGAGASFASSDRTALRYSPVAGERLHVVWDDLQHANYDGPPVNANSSEYVQPRLRPPTAAVEWAKPLSNRIVNGFPGPNMLPYVTYVLSPFVSTI